jgi:crotonobetainyl-CoA:carnitine CoA-transferase CaiB-like acyl-CoA transferase
MQVGDVANAEAQRYGKPLEGVRVLAIEQMQALPFGTQMLARLGADVVRVEPPGDGESGRQSLPAMTAPDGRATGPTFLRNNFDKRSISVDLKAPEGLALVQALIPKFDIVCENFKAGTAGRLGLGYEQVAKIHPGVIYLSVSGFGNTAPTPYANWPAYAPVAEAMAGLYEFKARPEGVGPVVSPLGALGDSGSAMFGVIGVLAALLHRARTGEGQYVDISMFDCMVALNDAGISYWSMGIDGGNAPLINHSFMAKDGWFIIQCGRAHQFAKMADLLGKPEWKTDPRLAGSAQWFEHLEDIIRPGVEAWAVDKTRLEAATALGEAGVASGPVFTPDDVVADEHVANRHMVIEMERTDGVAQPIVSPGNPVKMSKVAEGPIRRPPWVGEHTDEVLQAELGLDPAEISRLREAGVIA